MNAWPLFVWPTVGACAGVAGWAAVSSTSQLFGPTLHHTPDASRIALTFDDGPNPAQTPQLLALLGRYAVPATFFLVGRFARACPDLVREMADRGHSIGNHTETHRNLIFCSAARITREIRECEAALNEALSTGGTRPAAAPGDNAPPPPRLFRPPFGARRPAALRIARQLGYEPIMWSVSSRDWSLPSAEAIEPRKS